jgi:hypothetical protein
MGFLQNRDSTTPKRTTKAGQDQETRTMATALSLLVILLFFLGILLVSAIYQISGKIDEINRHLQQMDSDLREARKPVTDPISRARPVTEVRRAP